MKLLSSGDEFTDGEMDFAQTIEREYVGRCTALDLAKVLIAEGWTKNYPQAHVPHQGDSQ